MTTLGRAGTAYYQDTSLAHTLACAARGHRSVKGLTVINRFGEMLGSVALPIAWCGVIDQRCVARVGKDEPVENLGLRRVAPEENLYMGLVKEFANLRHPELSLIDQLRQASVPTDGDKRYPTRSAFLL